MIRPVGVQGTQNHFHEDHSYKPYLTQAAGDFKDIQTLLPNAKSSAEFNKINDHLNDAKTCLKTLLNKFGTELKNTPYSGPNLKIPNLNTYYDVVNHCLGNVTNILNNDISSLSAFPNQAHTTYKSLLQDLEGRTAESHQLLDNL